MNNDKGIPSAVEVLTDWFSGLLFAIFQVITLPIDFLRGVFVPD